MNIGVREPGVVFSGST